jgi:hypothetical protein
MQTFHAEIVVEKDGKLHLDHVPFSEGEMVHVFISSATTVMRQSLAGSVLKYEQPFAPGAEGDWEFGELERRAQRGSREKFQAAMAKVPDVPPMPGDAI